MAIKQRQPVLPRVRQHQLGDQVVFLIAVQLIVLWLLLASSHAFSQTDDFASRPEHGDVGSALDRT